MINGKKLLIEFGNLWDKPICTYNCGDPETLESTAVMIDAAFDRRDISTIFYRLYLERLVREGLVLDGKRREKALIFEMPH